MLTYALDGRPLPLGTTVAGPYFAAAREDRLVMQHCARDGFFFYPRSRCPACLGADWTWREARRDGLLHSFTVDRIGQDPGQRVRVPFVIALVDLADGPRMIGNMRTSAGRLKVGMPVRVAFERIDGEALLTFIVAD